ncbi:uncharacterized protein C8A04DRAFT_26613 [Dichotomopilus funicola]|uniref:Uncharacterized protein n=1 Tax=Dichotomopilus funicola TaxID=1934379 RepID=A0AAN6V6E7_9PEZI|nr:hypothetical protein C8A04DRAFT_26613 [Dichotomopilus funicola]
MFVDTQFPEQHRKRIREEDEEASSGSPVGFTEHRNKRFQSLPLRTSPNSKRWMDRPNFPLSNQTVAPTNHVQPNLLQQEPVQTHMWADEPELVSRNPPSSVVISGAEDDDMDMMDTSEPAVQRTQAGLQVPPNPEHNVFLADQNAPSVTGRIPTPIHCTFAAQVRGNSWSGGNAVHGDILATTPEEPNSAAFGSNGAVDLSTQKFASATEASAMADWNMVQNRRLPSPISECGAEDSQGNARMALDSPPLHGGHLSHLTHKHPLVAGLPPRASSAMEARTIREDTPGMAENQVGRGSAMELESPATPSPKKGHTRSKHTLNSWTGVQPGMTRSFSIGYRADCERCRNKVPGHFNHIIIS